MFSWLRRKRHRRWIRNSSITEQEWQQAFAYLPILSRLDAQEKTRLRELTILFLASKNFSTAHHLVLTRPMQMVIALQACLLVLNLGIEWFDNWQSIIVYPAQFRPNRTHMDEFGVLHQDDGYISGEAWAQGPVILSWSDVETSGELDGINLVIHEFAHKIDMLNGDANGCPPLHRNMNRQEWTRVFRAAYEDFSKRAEHAIDSGSEDKLEIDEYAATDPAEFFAVFSEVFFEQADRLYKLYPDVYKQLSDFYRQDPIKHG